MSCVFPGADSPQQFWQNIINKVDCITDAPADWDPNCFYDESGSIADRTYTTKGGFLGDLCRFNPAKYGVPPTNIDGAEPDQFIALRCAFEALADAGVPEIPLNRHKTSVIFGRGIFVNRGWVTVFQRSLTVEHVIDVLKQLEPDRTGDDLNFIRTELKKVLPPANADTFPGIVHNVLAGRIANRFDLMGPSYNVDAACASTLLAVEHGIQDLRAGRCDAVLAGGSQVSTPGPVHVMFCQLQALSRTGKIAPFSATANGTLLSQGCGLVVLKRRSDAERDGNRIYALIKSVGIASDGNGVGLLAPRSEGQQLAIARAYEESDLSLDSVSLIEAHGTGLPLGDATEFRSLNTAFGPQKNGRPDIAMGSVKSMLGHMLPAAGVGSIIKTALALYHRVLPPTLHADDPNPEFKFKESRFYLVNETRPWLRSNGAGPRRAGINAFGFGGINAHAVLEEYPHDENSTINLESQWPTELIVVTGSDRTDLCHQVTNLSDWLKRSPHGRLLDIAATCAEQNGPSRIAIVAKDVPDLIKKLDHAANLLKQTDRENIRDRSGIFWQAAPLARSGRLAVMFPGEGCQYANMLVDLCRHFPEVRQEFELTAGALAQRGLSLSHTLFPQPAATKADQSELMQMEMAVATVTAAARGLFRLLTRLQVRADAMVGHSTGEYASLLASGTCGDPDAERLIRIVIGGVDSAATLQKSNLVPEAVLVAAGGIPPEVLDAAVASSNGKVVVAMDNCPHQRILVGSEAAMATVIDQLKGKGGICQRLEWNRPYHTAAFEPGSKIVEQYIDSLKLQAPQIELWSCATARPFPSQAEAVRKLAVRQWSSPVRFRETVLAMYEAGVRVFIEAGPRGNLAAFVADTLGDRPHAVVPLAATNKNDLVQICHAVGLLVASGVEIKLSELFQRRRPVKLNLTEPLPALKREPLLRTDLPKFELSDEVGKRWRATSKIMPALAAAPPPPKRADGEPIVPDKHVVRAANRSPKVSASVNA
ncbi:MAG TPA: type I polyketide synthase, partial [Pirellulales bacterium]